MFEAYHENSIFLQPHADDVALSCGGAAAAASGATIITIFGGEVVGELSSFAKFKHARWNVGEFSDVHSTRRVEDAAAARILGCRLRWLGLPDAIYRGDVYQSDSQLYRLIDGEALELAEHLSVELVGLPEWSTSARVYVPLGVGLHADHQIVFYTGLMLAAVGYEVVAYEDTPYVIHTPDSLKERLKQVDIYLKNPVIFPVNPLFLDIKLEAVSQYRSQLPVLFRFNPDYRMAIMDYAAKVGCGMSAERFWPIDSLKCGKFNMTGGLANSLSR